MNILPSTWAFKLKRFPDGTVKKFKGRFCARGDKKIEGIDFFETYSPVVQWTTIRLMLILECVLGLHSKQGDVLVLSCMLFYLRANVSTLRCHKVSSSMTSMVDLKFSS